MDLLIIAPNDFDALKRKSVLHQYENYREGGYFTKVISLFPFTRHNVYTEIDGNKIFYQYGWMRKSNSFIEKFFGTWIILWKLLFVFPWVLKKFDIQIIRATDPYMSGLVGLFYAKLFDIPLVISVHSDYDAGAKSGGHTFKLLGSRKLAKIIERFVYTHCFKILPISFYIKNIIHTAYPLLKSEKFAKFPHGIDVKDFDDTDFIDIREAFGLDKTKKMICYVARLSKEKNCLDIPEIINSLAQYRNDFIFLIIGDGPEHKRIEDEIKQKGLSSLVAMIGFQNRKIVYNAKKSADVNLCLLDGYSLIEAALSTKPVVAYDTEWHSELIENDSTGYLVKEHDVQSMANKINLILSDQTLGKRLGDTLRTRTIEMHELHNTQEIKRNIYETVIKHFNEKDKQ